MRDAYNVVEAGLLGKEELETFYVALTSTGTPGEDDISPWRPYETPSSFRYVQSIVHDENLNLLNHQRVVSTPQQCGVDQEDRGRSRTSLPALAEHLEPVRRLLEFLLDLAEARRQSYKNEDFAARRRCEEGAEGEDSSSTDDELVPLQWFLCYYADERHSCPPHLHFCRQLTFTVGGDPGRIYVVRIHMLCSSTRNS